MSFEGTNYMQRMIAYKDEKGPPPGPMRCYREGKTRRDHKRGVHGNRFENRAKREAWQESANRKTHNPKTVFPVSACNGKKNRHRVTGKGGKSVLAEPGRVL